MGKIKSIIVGLEDGGAISYDAYGNPVIPDEVYEEAIMEQDCEV